MRWKLAVERRREADRGQSDLVRADSCARETTVRSSPPTSTPRAARVRMLETTNREIARRLDVAIESVRNVLEANDR